jgi:diamine N-acetyltransferase
MLELRELTILDVEKFAEVARKTFIAAYLEQETLSELEQFCGTHFSINKLSEDLQNVDYQHVGAFWSGEMVGYSKLNLSINPAGERDSDVLQVHRIYVLPEFWQQKIGRSLMDDATTRARNLAAKKIWLVVYNKNLRAQRFYEKLGFQQTGIFDFDFNGTMHRDFILEIDL